MVMAWIFQAGQYVNLFVPGVEHPRAFSIASSPSQRHELELNVRLVADGAATTYLHNELKVGDSVSMTAPMGRFFVRTSAPEPIIFLAGGSGLSSPKSMILDLLEAGDGRPITLLYGARNREELYYAELFRALAQEHENFSYHAALSVAHHRLQVNPGSLTSDSTTRNHRPKNDRLRG